MRNTEEGKYEALGSAYDSLVPLSVPVLSRSNTLTLQLANAFFDECLERNANFDAT